MDSVHPIDRLHRIVAVAEGRNRDKSRCPAQAAVHVLSEIRVVEHPLQRVRVEHLQQQPADTAGHHPDKIGVDKPDRSVAFKQRII